MSTSLGVVLCDGKSDLSSGEPWEQLGHANPATALTMSILEVSTVVYYVCYSGDFTLCRIVLPVCEVGCLAYSRCDRMSVVGQEIRGCTFVSSPLGCLSGVFPCFISLA